MLKNTIITVTVLAARDSTCNDPVEEETDKPAPRSVTLYKEYQPEIFFKSDAIFKGPHRSAANCGGSFVVTISAPLSPSFTGLTKIAGTDDSYKLQIDANSPSSLTLTI